MTGTARNIRQAPARTVGPSDAATAPYVERLEQRSAAHAAEYARAVALEARVLLGIHGAVDGVATFLRGIHEPRRWTAALAGERHLQLADLCRMATDPRREARAAVRAALVALAAPIGFRLEPLDRDALEAHEALAVVAAANGNLVAELARDLADGQLDASEAADLQPEIDALEAGVARLRATAAAARGERC